MVAPVRVDGGVEVVHNLGDLHLGPEFIQQRGGRELGHVWAAGLQHQAGSANAASTAGVARGDAAAASAACSAKMRACVGLWRGGIGAGGPAAARHSNAEASSAIFGWL